MEIQTHSEMIIFIQDSRGLIKKVYHLYIYFFIFWFLSGIYTKGIFTLLFWIPLILFYIFFTPMILYIKKNKFIVEQLFYFQKKGYLQIHSGRKKIELKKEFATQEIEDIYYEDLYMPLLNRGFESQKRIEESRYLKFKLKNGEIVSFGLFLKKEEAEKVIQCIIKS